MSPLKVILQLAASSVVMSCVFASGKMYFIISYCFTFSNKIRINYILKTMECSLLT